MSTETKGYIITECKDVRKIASALCDSIATIKGMSDIDGILFSGNKFINPRYNPSDDFLIYDFKDGSDKRALYVFLDCDCDHPELGDKKIILTLGCWGNSVALISQFMEALVLVTKPSAMFLHENDCDGEPIKFNPNE